MQELKGALKQAVKELFDVDVEPELIRPEEQFGDYSTNVAMQLGAKLGKQPREIAETIANKFQISEMVAKTDVAGPGFVNFFLSDKTLLDGLESQAAKTYAGQTIVLEHTDPNPFKEFHIGHAYSNTVGVAIGKLLENAGATIHQVTYQGDVGLHIAMAVYGMKKMDQERDGKPLSNITDENWPEFVEFGYATGYKAYHEKPIAKAEIEEINQQLYKRDNPETNRLYDEGRKRSLEEFEKIYQKLNAEFEKNYFESDTAKEGVEIVKQNLGKTFQESEGAVIYDGEKAGLHKRVFITKRDLPTYETKEIGLAYAKNRDYPNANKFIVITANEIEDYFKVLLAAIKDINPDLASKILHTSHGMVRLPAGKMSSRTGDVVTLNSLEVGIKSRIRELHGEGKDTPEVVFGSMKYEFLKHRIGQDITYDINESVSLQGNSGPYLQYAYVRARSILKKSSSTSSLPGEKLEPDERSLTRKIGEFSEVVEQATNDLLPSHICTYLYELAQNFNRFYEKNRILGDERQALRLKLVEAYAKVLKKGLSLLNISAPEKM